MIDSEYRLEEAALVQEHTVIMMLAVGLPREEIKVCALERRPWTEVYTRLEE